ncbi:M56 family metallopeptidase [Novosphingobium sp.]|uniref:M56 family metallopeptidase n=1 Tax=Novosphingobium sp. TaxID=1874826 RepID=UPI0025CE2118|nr:M56 family metallopeptidase [Novosphingobium sp.]MCC6926925.1 antirepressor regulating drug resistance protein [Novosphingobium sp.]
MTWLLDTALYTGALIALVLVLRRPVARYFGPGLAYALWALPLLRLVLPPLVLPADPVALVEPVSGVVVELVPAATTPPAPAWIDPAPVIQAVWLAGALAFLLWRVWSYRAMRRTLLAQAHPVGEHGAVRLVESPAIAAPVAFGLHDKVVALPLGFMDRTDRAGRDLAIAHELEHHAGRDLAANIAMQPLLALHWFNPLAWAGWRAMRRDQEAACDARVLAGRDAATRAAYARLITSFAHSPRLAMAAPMACPVLGEKSIIHRLRSLTMTQPKSHERLLGRLLLGAAVLALPLTASISYAAQDAPEPPAPPAAPAAPEAPAAPDAPKIQKTTKIMIVDHSDGAGHDDKTLHTRVIERGGKTIVLKTREPLSDAEAEARVAKAEAGMADAHVMAMADEHMLMTDNVTSDGKSHKVQKIVMVSTDGAGAPKAGKHEVRSFVMSHNGDGKAVAWTGDHAMAMSTCSEGKPITATSESNEGGKREVSRVMICSKAGDKAHALDGLKKARDRVARDSNLSDKIKSEILQQLDAEIAKLSKAG